MLNYKFSLYSQTFYVVSLLHVQHVSRNRNYCSIYIHDVTGDVERKKDRHLRQWKNENESCLRWDSNPRDMYCTWFSYLQSCSIKRELKVNRESLKLIKIIHVSAKCNWACERGLQFFPEVLLSQPIIFQPSCARSQYNLISNSVSSRFESFVCSSNEISKKTSIWTILKRLIIKWDPFVSSQTKVLFIYQSFS